MNPNNTYRTFRTMALIGLGIQILINLLAMIALKREAATFFSQEWWTVWFPGYMVWFVFLIIGLAGSASGAGKE